MPNEANTFVVTDENIDELVKRLVHENYMRRGKSGHSRFASLFKEENSVWAPTSGTGYHLVNVRREGKNHHMSVRKFGDEGIYRKFHYTTSKRRILLPVIGILESVNDGVERGIYLGQKVPQGLESTAELRSEIYIFPK